MVGLAEKKHLQWCQSFDSETEVARTLETAHAIEERWKYALFTSIISLL